ncbi:glycine receptor subunit alpha-2-like isoform X3 [Convolutriloba macropyga]|uniref:glycine receptor subunit alpha-2-like isoform X3 n=1 Tax=Convolutriloba macropyga TaxID=536237 RepID=UPI003F51B6FF
MDCLILIPRCLMLLGVMTVVGAKAAEESRKGSAKGSEFGTNSGQSGDCCSCCCGSQPSPQCAEVVPQHPVSDILSKLLANYDRRLRPQYGGDPVAVNVTMNIDSIGPISEVNMNFRLDISFRQYWKDQRLSFNYSEPVTVNSQFLEEIWQPDTYFPDSYESQRQTVMVPNILLRIHPDGLVLYSARVTVIAKCPMDLMYFPMDIQACKLMVECFGYTVKDLQLKWKEDPDSNAVEYNPENLQLAQFKLINVHTRQYNLQFSTGEFSDLEVVFYLKRDLIYFIIQTYIPATLIVLLSWVNFYVNRHSVPARASLAITTVLTMITLMGATNSNLPKVSSIKALDIYFGICFLYVFGALVEFALVCYFNKPRYTTSKQGLMDHMRAKGAQFDYGEGQFHDNAVELQTVPTTATVSSNNQVGIPWRLNTKITSNGVVTTPGEYGFVQGASTPMRPGDPRLQGQGGGGIGGGSNPESQPFLPLNITQNPSATNLNQYEHHNNSNFLPANNQTSNVIANSHSHSKHPGVNPAVSPVDVQQGSKPGSPSRDLEPSPSPQNLDENTRLTKKQRRKMRRKPINKPIDVSKIDLYSRIMFPLTYIMICIIYWMVYIGVTGLTQNSYEAQTDEKST